MSKNLGALDRAIRIIIGLVLLSLIVVGPRTAWGWIGLVPLITAFAGLCPLYRVLGISTVERPTGHHA
jgi:hypothetical protein